MIPLFDVALLVMSSYLAFVNAGTFLGWLLTIAVIFQTFLIIKFIRET